MRNEILSYLEQPKELERLYRENKSAFKTAFDSLYPEIKQHKTAEIWQERLHYKADEISWGSNREIGFVIVASFLAGIVAKIPAITGMNDELFYSRNIAFIAFPFLGAYFAWKNNVSSKKIIAVSAISLVALLFINLLPNIKESNTLVLSSIHLPLSIWSVFGYLYVANKPYDAQYRLNFLRYNGDLIVMTTLLLIAGLILSGITVGLFSVIGYSIERFYFEYIGVFGLAASTIVATYIIQTNPQLVNKVSPVIANIFSPLVLITLIIYLVAIILSGKDPYNDREFLIIFNALLVGVLALILFSVAEGNRSGKSNTGIIILFLLSSITVIVNGIALSAILFRISEMGITPNRLAVLGSNILILINLIWVSALLFKSIKNRQQIQEVEQSIATFLPYYSAWTAIVSFIFPFVFQFN